MNAAQAPTVLIVPGLRDHVDAHWQTLLGAHLKACGREELGTMNLWGGVDPAPAATV